FINVSLFKDVFIPGGTFMLFRSIAAVFFALCLSMTAFAQQPAADSATRMQHYGHGMMHMWGMANDQQIDRALDTLKRTLNLNASQVTSIRQLAQSRRQSFQSIREQAHPKFEQLMTLLKQPNPDPAAVGRAVIDLKAIHEQVKAKQNDLEKQI